MRPVEGKLFSKLSDSIPSNKYEKHISEAIFSSAIWAYSTQQGKRFAEVFLKSPLKNSVYLIIANEQNCYSDYMVGA